MTIQTLVDAPDRFELVRDEIAAIIATESASQMALAAAAAKDPTLWKLRVFIERANPWGEFQDEFVDGVSPIVNVWHDSSAFDGTNGSPALRQEATGRFNIDVVAYGRASGDGTGGHTPGDLAAMQSAQRAARLVRNFLMAAEYRYLNMQPHVGLRWIDSVTSFRPGGDNSTQIAAARIVVSVRFNEYPPEYQAETLETLSASVYRSETGEVYFTAEY